MRTARPAQHRIDRLFLPPIIEQKRVVAREMQRTEKIPSIVVLLTCFNRRESTLLALESLFSQNESIPRRLTVILVDDASTDGTREAVTSHYPQVRVLKGNGLLYWSGGMRMAFAEAMRTDFDFYLWLNDDTHLFSYAIDRMLESALQLEQRGENAVVTGSTCDPVQQRWTYGGFRRHLSRRGLQFLPVPPLPHEMQQCDTMNGNCTLIPRAVARVVGNLDPIFSHGLGDFDYGLRARARGHTIYLAPGFVGTCAGNSITGTWKDKSASFSQRWRHLTSPKGLPFKEWLIYTHRHFGALWPLYAVSPYIKTIFGIGLHAIDLNASDLRSL